VSGDDSLKRWASQTKSGQSDTLPRMAGRTRSWSLARRESRQGAILTIVVLSTMAVPHCSTEASSRNPEGGVNSTAAGGRDLRTLSIS
jgi:hypothetical protein